MGLQTIKLKSFTTDEPFHTVRAIAIQQGQDFRHQHGHTPLAHWTAGQLLPMTFFEPLDQSAYWAPFDRTGLTQEVFTNLSRSQQTLLRFLVRTPILMLGLIIVSIITVWTRQISNVNGSIIALVLAAFSPNLLANANLITTDFSAAAGFTIALFALWHYQNRPWSWPLFLMTGLALGVGIAGKMTNLVLLPIWFVAVIFDTRRPTVLERWGGLIGMGTIGLTVLWGFYGFGWGPIKALGLEDQLLPAGYFLNNFFDTFAHVQVGHSTSYLLGEVKFNDGWYAYFPTAILIKTQLPFLILFFVSLLSIRQTFTKIKIPLLSALFLFCITIVSNLNIGFRHALPVLPLLFVSTAVGIAHLPESIGKSPIYKIILLGLLTWYATRTLIQHPNHLSFFNELVGGSANGHFYLADSNLDWGQELLAAEEYADGVTLEPVYLSVNVTVPATYVYDVPLLDFSDPAFPAANPDKGTYIISYNQLNNIVLPTLSINRLNWFQNQTPVDTINHAMAVFEVEAPLKGAWVVQCPIPYKTFTPEELRSLLNQVDLEMFEQDCENNQWEQPSLGSGWVVLPEQINQTQMPQNQNAELVYAHPHQFGVPKYYIYYVSP